MRKILIAMMACSALAAGLPSAALAHDDEYGAVTADNDWDNGGATYGQFNQEYQHIWDGIQHGLSDGSYSRRQAWQFNREMRQIRARADWDERYGRFDPQATQARLESLHERMHVAHERGHARLDYYGQRTYGYGQQGYNNGYGYSNGYRNNNGNGYYNGYQNNNDYRNNNNGYGYDNGAGYNPN